MVIQIWNSIWIGGRSKLIILKDPINKGTLNSSKYIRKVLLKGIKRPFKRGTLTSSFFSLFYFLFR